MHGKMPEEVLPHLVRLVAVCSVDGLPDAGNGLLGSLQEILQLIQGESAEHTQAHSTLLPQCFQRLPMVGASHIVCLKLPLRKSCTMVPALVVILASACACSQDTQSILAFMQGRTGRLTQKHMV
jgi:hypothetical protein